MAAAENQAAQAPNDTAGDAYVNTTFDGSFPAAIGEIAKKIGATTPEVLKEKSKNLYNFLSLQAPNLHQLNGDDSPYTALVPLPYSHNLRLVYGLEVGTSPIGSTSQVDGHILVLTKEANEEIGPPVPLALPPEMIKTELRPCPSGTRVQDAITAAHGNLTFPTFRSAAIALETATMMMIAPVPAHLFLDGFEDDIPAVTAYERLIQSADVEEPYVQHALAVVRAAMLQVNRDQKSVHLPMEALLRSGNTRDIRKWARQKVDKNFPNAVTPIQQHPPLPPTPPRVPQLRPEECEVELIKAPAPKKEKFSQRERRKIFIMMGYDAKTVSSLSEQNMPEHILAVEEETTRHMKDSVIKEQLESQMYYEDCPVPSHPTLLETLRKRDFAAPDSFSTPSYAQACSKLTPFLCMDISETKMAQIKEVDEAFRHASVTTPSDYIALKSSKAIVPETYTDFVTLLCTYTNLVYAWFTAASPLYIQLKRLVTAIKAFHRTARCFFTTETKATILWLTLLQSRLFAEGKGHIFAPFTRMIDNLVAKDTRIHYAEVPQELINNSTAAHGKHTLVDNDTNNNVRANNKRKVDDAGLQHNERKNPRQEPAENPNNWNPTLKKTLGPIIEKITKQGVDRKQITITQVSKFCGINTSIFAGQERSCLSNKILGTCYYGSRCRNRHKMASEEEAKKILTILEKLTKDPDSFKDSLKST